MITFRVCTPTNFVKPKTYSFDISTDLPRTRRLVRILGAAMNPQTPKQAAESFAELWVAEASRSAVGIRMSPRSEGAKIHTPVRILIAYEYVPQKK